MCLCFILYAVLNENLNKNSNFIERIFILSLYHLFYLCERQRQYGEEKIQNNLAVRKC